MKLDAQKNDERSLKKWFFYHRARCVPNELTCRYLCFLTQLVVGPSVDLQPTTSLTPAHLTPPQPPPSLRFQLLPPSFSPSFGPPLRFIARGRQTAEKPPCMERSVISTLSSKHTAFHIVLQGLGQIAIFMGHDKGNAALCSHFLLPSVRAGHAVIHCIGNHCSLRSACLLLGGWKRKPTWILL